MFVEELAIIGLIFLINFKMTHWFLSSQRTFIAFIQLLQLLRQKLP